MRRREHGRARVEEIGRFWDAVVDGEPSEPGRLDPELAETVRGVHGIQDVPGPDPRLVAQIWADALRQAGMPVPADGEVPAVAPNARQRANARPIRTRTARETILVTLATGAVAGLLAGAVALGLGLRLAMRIAGFLTEPARRGALTEAGNRVGEITVGGTISLLVVGAVLGSLGGIVYMIVRPWLPWAGWRRGLLFGVMLFAVGGQELFEHGQNPDYRRFGIAGLNVCLFGLLPILFGSIVGPLADRMEPRMAARFAAGPTVLRPRLRAVGPVVAATFGMLVILFGVLAAPPLGIVPLLALVRALLARAAGRFDAPADLLRRPLLAAPAYALIVVPCVIGLVLTLQSIGRILG